MARKNKKQEDHDNHERWLITYADLITLLLIFFVILYSMSKLDVAKYTLLAQTLNAQFKKVDTTVPHGRTGQLGPGSSTQNKTGQNPDGSNPEETVDTAKKSQQQSEEEKKLKEAQIKQKEQELQNLLAKIEKYIADNQLQIQVSAEDRDRGIAITLNDLFLFDSGKADLKPASFPILAKLASLFPTLDTSISIEGHTDSQPLSTGSIYRDNEGLSAARSLSVLRYFMQVPSLDPRKFFGTFYADSRPVAANDTPENLQKNRRVEIIVLREQVPVTVPAQ